MPVMKSLILVACLFLFAACQPESGMNQRLKPLAAPDTQPKAEFIERYKGYRCAENELPFVEESQGPGSCFRSMKFGEHLVLKLELGKRVHVNGEASGPMRTKSRYRLFWDGMQMGEAESLFSTTAGYDSPEPHFYYNAECQSLLVYEVLEWTTKRCIAFERGIESGSSEK